ncbi:FlgB family protein [Roseovarius sp. LXJ103]|uniref:FlgB family protein n=1 Tax=Roseovarius carneus TaxID=2853164 RepID=UPI000D61819B|nr:FlgB family protein [Roseovarius carneus]MBZ8117533.1 FlgB family protein [Roseovarius carneus]PWE36672.1 flagellar biosynthesis protein FlgB [Pelagicola sp. LXJ1103]
MFEKLEIFRMAHAMAKHAGARQAIVARNMANADTPGYAARDIAPFAETFKGGQIQFAPRQTRAGHIGENAAGYAVQTRERATGVTDPNGNSVSLETEMLKAVDVKRQHDRAISIYKSSLTILRAATGRR